MTSLWPSATTTSSRAGLAGDRHPPAARRPRTGERAGRGGHEASGVLAAAMGRDPDGGEDPANRARRQRLEVAQDAHEGLLGARLVGVDEQDRELVAAGAREDVAGAQVGLQRVGHREEQRVARDVAMLAVDGPEAVEVEQDDRHRAPVAARAVELGLQLGAERAQGELAGDGVAAGEPVALGLELRDPLPCLGELRSELRQLLLALQHEA